MKLIHCADLHLASKLNTHLDRERAKRRRDELLQNFVRLADYARENRVEAVLIAGDLFDGPSVPALVRNMVLTVIREHPQIHFYYLRGNHDSGDCLRKSTETGEEVPGNLFLFGYHWKTYSEGRNGFLSIAGIELTPANQAAACSSLRLDPAGFNIVMLHGQETAGGSGGDASGAGTAGGNAGLISLRALRGKGIDYLALGHIHAWKKASLDSRGVYCYPGCLEGRGFDECGPRGFALIEIDEKSRSMKHRFVPFAKRTLYAVEADVTGCRTTAQMKGAVDAALTSAGCRAKDMAEVILCGELDVECEKDTGYLRTELESRFFFAKLTDRTVLRIDPEEYMYDESLRGEFVRTVMADPSVPSEEKAAVIRYGFQAMDGETL